MVLLVLLVVALPLYTRDTPEDVAGVIGRFLERGRDDSREFDEYIYIRDWNPAINAIKQRLRAIDAAHSSAVPPHYLSAEGLKALRELLASVRGPAA